MYVLPSVFTAGNIAAGFYAITQSLQGSAADHSYFDRAAIAIALAVPFDALDGRIARLTNTESDFGRELDSLADVITFGVAPAVLAYIWGFRMLPVTVLHPVFRLKLVEIGVFVCFLFLICGACRLARFNVTVNPQPRNPGRPGRKYFVGMPIPAAAGVIVSVVHCFNGSPIYDPWISLVWMGLVLFTGFLMVSRWRFWSAKEIRVESKQPMRLLIVLVVLGVLLAYWSEYVLIIVALAYMVSGMWARLMYAAQARSAKARRAAL
jgi:CDP-diacylglycerol--serine O-phosphatidyltransferase